MTEGLPVGGGESLARGLAPLAMGILPSGGLHEAPSSPRRIAPHSHRVGVWYWGERGHAIELGKDGLPEVDGVETRVTRGQLVVGVGGAVVAALGP